MAPVWEKGGGRIFVLKSWWEIFHHVIFFLLFNPPCIPLLSLVLAEKTLNISSSSKGPSPCTCSFLLRKTGHKGTTCEKENSQFSPLLTVSSVSGMFLHSWLCHTIPCRTPSPTRIFPGLGPQQPLTNHPDVQTQRSSFGGASRSFRKPCPGSRKPEQPMKLASFKNLCIRQKWRIFQRELDMSQSKRNKTGNQRKPSGAGVLAEMSTRLSHASWCWKKEVFMLRAL